MLLASEFVEKLQALIREHGNLMVVMEDDSEPTAELYDDGPDDRVFVIS